MWRGLLAQITGPVEDTGVFVLVGVGLGGRPHHLRRLLRLWMGAALHPDTNVVGTLILSHTDLACNTSYHFAASCTVFPRVPPYLTRDRLRRLAHVYDSVASIHMTENPGRHD